MKPGPHALDLIRLAQDYRADQCRTLLTHATARSGSMLHQAQVTARRHLRAVLAPDLARHAAELSVAESRLVTQRRLRDQKRVVRVLDQAWPPLVQALRARWETAPGRTAWVTHHLATALLALPARGWVIQHPQDWPAPEREQTDQWLQTQGIQDARFEIDAQLGAGIRVVCGRNVLDATLDGLLTDRTQIEGRLLHHLARKT
jgi:hypothetical protein